MGLLVFDSAPLSCFARAGKLSLLDRLTQNDERVTTRAVLDELRQGVGDYPQLEEALTLSWLKVVPVDSLRELQLFAEYARHLGSGKHDTGEASVLAWAEAHGAIAFTDDSAAVQIAQARGVKVQRTLALVVRGLKSGLLSEQEAHDLIDELARAGARFPVRAGEFLAWARAKGLLT